MHFTTAGGFGEAALGDEESAITCQLSSPSGLRFSFTPVKRRGRGQGHAPLFASLILSRSRGHQGAVKGLLASLTGFALFQGRDSGLRRTFNSIDVDGKGHITQQDIEAFANRNGLPANYVSHFASAVRASAGKAAAEGARGGQQQPQDEDADLTFAMFRQFVRSREEALKRAFSLFDRDGDGRISVDDLDASLSRVAVCCPQTRCIYRCPNIMAKKLLSTAAPDHGYLGFSEFRDFFLLLPQQDMLVEYWVAAGAAPELSDKVSISRTGDAAGAKGSPWGHLLAGAVAGATSRTATAPLETLRLAAMAGQLQSRSLAQAASDIVSSQGWQGLYRGNLLNVMRSAPQKALDFFAFDAFKRIIGDDTHVQTFLAAGLAGCTSWVALYPLEVVRSRITVAAAAASAAAASAGSQRALAGAAAATPPNGLIAALSSIVRVEGPGALYKGLGPSVAAIFPEAAITYGLHDALKKAYTRVAHEEPGVAPSLAFGVLSAFMGQLVSFPLETVSRRMQVAGAGVSGMAGAAVVVRSLLAEGGPAALYRGIGAATLRLVPMACVSFGTYEVVRALVVAWEQQQEDSQVKAMLTSRCVPLVLDGPGGPEVVGRLCTPPGAQGPSLCGAVNGSTCPGSPAAELQPVAARAPSVSPAEASEVAGAGAALRTPCSPCTAAAATMVTTGSSLSSACSGAMVLVPEPGPAGACGDGQAAASAAAAAGVFVPAASASPCGGRCGVGVPSLEVSAGAPGTGLDGDYSSPRPCGCPVVASACHTLAAVRPFGYRRT